MNSGHAYVMSASPASRRSRRGGPAGTATHGFNEFNPLGSVSSPEERERQRERQGYCLTCQSDPVKLFNIKKNKLNPLRRIKEPRSVAGYSLNGVCLVCNPHLNPNRQSYRQISRSSNGTSQAELSPGVPRSRVNCASPVSSPMASPRPVTSITRARPPPSPHTSPHANGQQPATRSPRPVRSPLELSPPGPPLTHPNSSSQRPFRTTSEDFSQREEVDMEELAIPMEQPCGLEGSGASLQLSDIPRTRRHDGNTPPLRNSQASNTQQASPGSSYSSLSASGLRARTPSPPRQNGLSTTAQRPSIPAMASVQSMSTRHFRDDAAAATRSCDNDEADIEQLKLLINELGGNIECVADILAEASRSHRKSESFQLFFLERLCSLCKHNDEHKMFFASIGIQDDVFNAMESNLGSTRVQEMGCAALWTLGVNEQNRKVLAKAGAGEVVYKALNKHMDNEGVAKKAVSALRTLSSDPQIQKELAQYMCGNKVTEAMALHRHVVDIQRDGCAFLSNCALEMDTKTVSVVPYEQVKAVVRALGYHTKNDKVASCACFALKNFTYEEQNLRTMRRFSNLDTLLQDASRYSNNRICRDDAIDILESINLSKQLDQSLEQIVFNSFADAMRSPTAAKNVTDIMQENMWSSRLTSEGLESLDKLANESDMQRHMIVDSLDFVLECMSRHEDISVQTNGCQLLRSMADSGAEGRSAVCRKDVCPAILNAMRNFREHVEVQEAAAGAFCSIASEVKFSSMTQEADLLAAVQESMSHHPDNMELQHLGSQVVTLLSEQWS